MADFNKSCRNKNGRDKYCRECRKIVSTEYRKNNPEKYRECVRRSVRKLRINTIQAYGGKCACCGELNQEFLTIDHINGDGRQHKEQVGESSGVYRDLKKRDYPKDDYRCLCMNCNWSIGMWGYCPHEKPQHSD